MVQNQLSNQNTVGVPLHDDEVRQEQQVQIIPRSSTAPTFEHGFIRFSQFNDQDFLRQVSMDIQNQPLLAYAIVGPASIGLKLEKTESLAELIERKLSAENENNGHSIVQQGSRKIRAEHFPIKCLQIGGYRLNRLHEGHLVAKCYYAKRKLVWEILQGGLKKKIEILWDDISDIRANLSQGALEIMLKRRPSFYCEREPTPGKHTVWNLSEDFTGSEAFIVRKHYLEFDLGVLDKPYSKLIQCDEKLNRLSSQPFPDLEPPFFTSSHIDHRTTNPSYNNYHINGYHASSSTSPVPLLLSSTEQDQQFCAHNSSANLDISHETEVIINNNCQRLIQDSRPTVSHGGYAESTSGARKQPFASTPSPQKVHQFKDLITSSASYGAIKLSTSPAFDTCRVATEVINNNQRLQDSQQVVQHGQLFNEAADLSAKNSMLNTNQQQPSSSTAAPMPSSQQLQQFRCPPTLASSLGISNSTLGISTAETEVINNNQMLQDSMHGGLFDEYANFTIYNSLSLSSASHPELLDPIDKDMRDIETYLHSQIDGQTLCQTAAAAAANSSATTFAAPVMQLENPTTYNSINNSTQIDYPLEEIKYEDVFPSNGDDANLQQTIGDDAQIFQ